MGADGGLVWNLDIEAPSSTDFVNRNRVIFNQHLLARILKFSDNLLISEFQAKLPVLQAIHLL